MYQLVLVVVILGLLSVGSLHSHHRVACSRSKQATISNLHAVNRKPDHGKRVDVIYVPVSCFGKFQRRAFRALILASSLSFAPEAMANSVDADSTRAITNPTFPQQVIDLNVNEPKITKTCWLDLKLDSVENGQLERVDIGLYGEVMPITTTNFENLATGKFGFGYKGSDMFRVINDFSVQGGNINKNSNTLPSQRGKEGKAAVSETESSFPVENYDIQHSYVRAGVISMMKDVKGQQDSRFFITLSPQAGWADNRYSAFGRVTKGMTTIAGLQALDVTPPSNFPNPRVMIENSGCYQ